MHAEPGGRGCRGQAHNGELGYGAHGKKSSANPDKCMALEGVHVHQVCAGWGGTPFGARAWLIHHRPCTVHADHRPLVQVALGIGHGLFLADPEHATVKAAEIFTPAVLKEEVSAAPEPAPGKGATFGCSVAFSPVWQRRLLGRGAWLLADHIWCVAHAPAEAEGSRQVHAFPANHLFVSGAGAPAKAKGKGAAGKRKADAEPAKPKRGKKA